MTRFTIFGVLLGAFLSWPTVQLQAQITATGDISPSYDGSDPWDMGTTPIVGITGVGSVLVEGNSQIRSTAINVGDQVGSNGTVTISGAGASWVSFGAMDIGVGGVGTVNIENDSFVNSAGIRLGFDSSGEGELNVSGRITDVSGLTVGQDGRGTVNITDGGDLTTRFFLIGDDQGSNGTLRMTGANAKLQFTVTGSGTAAVGVEGAGNLILEDGAQFSQVGNRDLTLGFRATGNGNATVTGANSLISIQDDIFVGREGGGTLRILDGGKVTADWVDIGSENTGNGEVTVAGSGSTLMANRIEIGSTGAGTLNLGPGGHIQANGDVFGSTGSNFNMDGGLLEFTSAFGGLSVRDHSITGGTIRNADSLSSSTGFFDVENTRIEPGDGIGSTNVGRLKFHSGVLAIDIDGADVAGIDFDTLTTSSSSLDLLGDDLSADVLLELSLGYAPEFGDELQIVNLINDSSFLTGRFQNGEFVTGSFGGQDYTFQIDYFGGTGNDIVLRYSAIPEPASAFVLLFMLAAGLGRRPTRA